MANRDIGYSVPFRILSFVYGMIFSFYVIPKYLYDIYYKGETIPYYSILPIIKYLPVGNLEAFTIGAFCYQDDSESLAARAKVVSLYSEAFTKSKG